MQYMLALQYLHVVWQALQIGASLGTCICDAIYQEYNICSRPGKVSTHKPMNADAVFHNQRYYYCVHQTL